MSEFKAQCGCAIHVVQWTSKRKFASVKYCPTHKGLNTELLQACRDLVAAAELEGSDSQQFYEARNNALALIARTEKLAKEQA